MLTALLYLAGVLVAVYAIQSSDVTHCVIALLVLFVGGGVYLIALGNEFVGLSLSQKLSACVAYMKAYLGRLSTRAGYWLLELGLIVVARVGIISLSWSDSLFFRNMRIGFYPVRHPFHLVNPSPWPFVTSLCVLCFLLGVTMYLHSWVLGGWLSILGFGALGLSLASWWEDVVTESTFEGHHTSSVQRGIKIGMSLFMVSEVMFFFSFFWSFFYYSVSPTIWVGCVWPPLGIEAPSPWGVPFFNTALLMHSGMCLTWAHFGMLCNSRFSTLNGFLLTIKMGGTFLGFQLFEYLEAPFSISSSVYGSIFFLATGFHGFHVTMGLVFMLVCFFRYRLNHFWNTQHVGFELASWYWHFVDVVWIFLFISIYWWGGAVDSA